LGLDPSLRKEFFARAGAATSAFRSFSHLFLVFQKKGAVRWQPPPPRGQGICGGPGVSSLAEESFPFLLELSEPFCADSLFLSLRCCCFDFLIRHTGAISRSVTLYLRWEGFAFSSPRGLPHWPFPGVLSRTNH